MKIFYAVQATGNGHISRAKQILPYLHKHGDVDIFLSGSNSSLDVGLPVKYRSGGISLFFKECGGISYKETIFNNSYLSCFKDIKDLPLEKYDVVINDFDLITAYAAKMKNIKSVQFSHQASFMSENTPRPQKKSYLGESILKRYAPATNYMGMHFKAYDDFIKSPVIKKEVLEGRVTDKGHVTVYLPAVDKVCLQNLFHKLSDIKFHWFLSGVNKVYEDENITFHPISNKGFTESMLSAHGILTGGGFETPSEAMYLHKKIACVPIEDHYEQQCNAEAAKQMGATVWYDLEDDTDTAQNIREWYESNQKTEEIIPNDIEQTIEELISI